MAIEKQQIEAIKLYLLYQMAYPQDMSIVLKNRKKQGIVTKLPTPVISGALDIANYLHFDKLDSIIESFYETMKTSLPHCSLAAFFKNIRNLKISENKKSVEDIAFDLCNQGVVALEYDSKKNQIRIYPNTYASLETAEMYKQASITQGLLHMASTYKKGLVRISGFHQTMANVYEVGFGINNAYTDYLNQKYFNQAPRPFYSELHPLAKGIEMLIGSEKMEQLYFQGDLKGLVTEIEKYSSSEQAITLIRDIDRCYYERDDSKKSELIGDIQSNIAEMCIIKESKPSEKPPVKQY